MTEPASQTPGHVDLATLTSGLHVLGVAPAWSAVERALGRLDSVRATGTGTDDPKVQEDLQTVHEFHQLLERGAQTVALALLCGAVLGQASGARSFGERLLAGLRAISRSYGFDRLDEGERRTTLRELWRTLSVKGLVPEPIEPIPSRGKKLDLAKWEPWCRRLRNAVDQPPETSRLRNELSAFQEQAWSLWQKRLSAPARVDGRTSWPKPEPALADLVCGAAGVSPAIRLDLDVMRMGLVAWSDTVISALAPPSSREAQVSHPWVLVPGLHRLGFRLPGLPNAFYAILTRLSRLRETPPSSEDPELLEWLTHWDRFFRRGVRTYRPAILVVRREENSMTSPWRVPVRGAALALTEEQLSWLGLLGGSSALLPPAWLGIGLILVEMPREPSAGVPTIVSLARRLFAPWAASAALVPPGERFSEAGDVPMIHGTRNIDDLIQAAIPSLARPPS